MEARVTDNSGAASNAASSSLQRRSVAVATIMLFPTKMEARASVAVAAGGFRQGWARVGRMVYHPADVYPTEVELREDQGTLEDPPRVYSFVTTTMKLVLSISFFPLRKMHWRDIGVIDDVKDETIYYKFEDEIMWLSLRITRNHHARQGPFVYIQHYDRVGAFDVGIRVLRSLPSTAVPMEVATWEGGFPLSKTLWGRSRSNMMLMRRENGRPVEMKNERSASVGEEERRLWDKKKREEFQVQMNKEVSVKLDRVYEVINGKKSVENDKVAKLKARIDELQKWSAVASTSSDAARPSSDVEEVARLRSEQFELKKATDKRLAAMEEVIHALQRQCEEAKANAKTWKAKALRPGNKSGVVVIGPTPATQT
ncbi:hypothetical protein CBR_g70733 [Chara braunii]|uniref:Uncharacterized protein n=1 Tax=Chara braunii TaxID=69332 RepID=A0A388KA04_CHABU|nr:hypothetical protein CBR_g70733 [Chara braunii]|eukprot:GBG66856.1 hypothetical protein CBR_g70733 [Chara braunii]